MTYKEILQNAPPHNTSEFLEYLAANNRVVHNSPYWLVIENCKYHRKDRVWYTAFAKLDPQTDIQKLILPFGWLTYLAEETAEETNCSTFSSPHV